MKSSRNKRGRIVEAPKELKSCKGWNQLKKSPKRNSWQFPNAKGDSLIPRNQEASLSQTSPKLPTIEEHLEQTLPFCSKIKLQLFPLDDHTRLQLEKDGFHPYLELTLSARKKISSVLKHLHSKWGSSSIAAGEPMLFPYDREEHLASYRWTKDDLHIRANDIYAILGSPAVFRLRYGWISDLGTQTLLPSGSAPSEACLKSEGLQEDCSTGMVKEHNRVLAKRESTKPDMISGANKGVDAKMPVNGKVVPMDNEMRMGCIIEQPSTLWYDSLTDISIGGLLSEASLQGRLYNSDVKSRGVDAGLQSSQLISDSFDAFLSGQMNCSSIRQPANDSHSSILDAEDTCHAFAFQKCVSSRNHSGVSGASAYPPTSNHDEKSKSCLFPSLLEANYPSVLTKGQDSHGSDIDLMLCSRVYNDESSLGLSGIKWTDTLGPFDLGPPSQKFISGDNGSLSGIVS